jgi:rubrerythrin
MSNIYHILDAFDYVADAELVKAKLESEGIQVVLKDANILQADPFIASAIGGVKVMVFREDREKAEEIYNDFRRYAVDKKGNPVICPNCKAARSERYHDRSIFWHRLFPFLEPVKYRCRKCEMITQG